MEPDNRTSVNRYRRYYTNIGDLIKKPKSQAYTAAIFSFLVVSLFGWYAIRPTLQTILFLRREIADNKLVNQQMEDKIAKLIEAQATYETIQDDLPLLSQALPNNPDSVNIVSQLRNLGSVSQASVSSITIAKVPLISKSSETNQGVATVSGTTKSSKSAALSTKKVADLQIVVVTSGIFGNIQSFISGIVQMRRIISIEEINISPDKTVQTENLTGEAPLRAILKLKAHYID